MKTYKRETAWAFAVLVLALFGWGVFANDQTSIDVAKFLTPFMVTILIGALGMDAYAKQVRK